MFIKLSEVLKIRQAVHVLMLYISDFRMSKYFSKEFVKLDQSFIKKILKSFGNSEIKLKGVVEKRNVKTPAFKDIKLITQMFSENQTDWLQTFHWDLVKITN